MKQIVQFGNRKIRETEVSVSQLLNSVIGRMNPSLPPKVRSEEKYRSLLLAFASMITIDSENSETLVAKLASCMVASQSWGISKFAFNEEIYGTGRAHANDNGGHGNTVARRAWGLIEDAIIGDPPLNSTALSVRYRKELRFIELAVKANLSWIKIQNFLNAEKNREDITVERLNAIEALRKGETSDEINQFLEKLVCNGCSVTTLLSLVVELREQIENCKNEMAEISFDIEIKNTES